MDAALAAKAFRMSQVVLNPIWVGLWPGLNWRFRHECEVSRCDCVMFTGIVSPGMVCTTCNHLQGWHCVAKTTTLYERECVICLDSLSIVRLPCRHLCVCENCSELLYVNSPACPLCRAEFAVISR